MNQSSIIRVADLTRGDTVDGLLMVDSVNFKQTRAGKPFLQLMLRDSTGRVRAIKWEAERDLYQSIRVSDVVTVRGRVEEFQGNRQLVLDEIRVAPSEHISWHTFLPEGTEDVEELWARLYRAVADVADAELRELLLSLLNDPAIAEPLKSWPAGRTLHHAHRGGLIEHIVSIIGASQGLVQHWPRLDLDLMVAGALLHDIGKLKELTCDMSIQYSDRGQLVGHVGIALQMLREKVRDMPGFSEETLLEIEHLIVSHHGKVEYGALREPMTAEAIALHFLDNMDARLAAYFAITQSEETGPYGENWTDFHPMFGARLYKPQRLRGVNK